MAILKKASGFIISKLELLFFKWGRFVSLHPYPVILSSVVITALCSLGFINFRSEHKANLLWIPADSDYNVNQDWLDNHFKKNTREEVAVFVSDNVLTPDALRLTLQVHTAVGGIEEDGKTFEDICARVPIADIFQTKKRKKRELNITDYDDNYDFWTGEYDEYSDENEVISTKERIDFNKYGKKSEKKKEALEAVDDLPDNIYCDLVTTLNEKCVLTNLLEIWRYDEDLINTVTQEEIVRAVNVL